MLIVDSLIISGIKFVLTRIVEAVDAEMYDETALREELLAAQMRLELGEISEEDFAAIEEQVLAGMREIRERKKAAAATVTTPPSAAGAPSAKITVESVEANLDYEGEPPDAR